MLLANFKNLFITLLSIFLIFEVEATLSKVIFGIIAGLHLVEYVVVLTISKRIKKVFVSEDRMPDHIKEKMADLKETLRKEILKEGGALDEMLPPCDDPTCMECRIRTRNQ